jgi:hypothetical protein
MAAGTTEIRYNLIALSLRCRRFMRDRRRFAYREQPANKHNRTAHSHVECAEHSRRQHDLKVNRSVSTSSEGGPCGAT